MIFYFRLLFLFFLLAFFYYRGFIAGKDAGIDARINLRSYLELNPHLLD